jgi:hypothetical protein
MSVKLAVLKSGENIISDIKEGFLEEKLVCYILEKPCTVSVNGTYRILEDEDENETTNGSRVSISLNSWPSLSKDTTVELVPDWIVTIVEPNDQLKKMYETQVLGIEQNDETISTDEQSDLGLTD